MSETTSLIRHQSNIYKVKIYLSSSSRSQENVMISDIQPAVRAVLYAEERGRTLSSIEMENFIITYTKKYWRASEKLGFKQQDKVLEAYPYNLIFTVHVKEQRAKRALNRTIEVGGHRARAATVERTTRSRTPGILSDNVGNSLRAVQSCRREPVVVLERLNVPVSKKPEDIVKERQIRTSPRRKTAASLLDYDRVHASRKRHIDAISDQNLPFCRQAKLPRHNKGNSSVKEVSRKRTPLAENRAQLVGKGKRGSPRGSPVKTPRGARTKGETPLRAARAPLVSPRLHNKTLGDTVATPGRKTLARNGTSPYTRQSPRIKSLALTDNQKTVSPRSPAQEKHNRTSSGFWHLIETIMTPVKFLTRRRTR